VLDLPDLLEVLYYTLTGWGQGLSLREAILVSFATTLVFSGLAWLLIGSFR
jgi:hypothetical protein